MSYPPGKFVGSWPMLVSVVLRVQSPHSGDSGVHIEAGVYVSAAAHCPPACGSGAMPGIAPRAVQRRPAGTTGRVAAAGSWCLLRGPVGPAQGDPGGPAGCGGVVVLVPAGDPAPFEQGIRRVLPAG